MSGRFLAAACAMVATIASASTGWRSYVNVRYQYSLCYPAELKAGREADNSDGKTFKGRDALEVSVWGEQNIDALPLDRLASAEGVPASGRVTYRFHRGNVAVVSGFVGGRIFYTKLIQRRDEVLLLAITYNKAAQPRYDRLTAAMSRCFKSTA